MNNAVGPDAKAFMWILHSSPLSWAVQHSVCQQSDCLLINISDWEATEYVLDSSSQSGNWIMFLKMFGLLCPKPPLTLTCEKISGQT